MKIALTVPCQREKIARDLHRASTRTMSDRAYCSSTMEHLYIFDIYSGVSSTCSWEWSEDAFSAMQGRSSIHWMLFSWNRRQGKAVPHWLAKPEADSIPDCAALESGSLTSDKSIFAFCRDNIKILKSYLDMTHPHARRAASDSLLPLGSFGAWSVASPDFPS